ncbi:MAG: zinc ribbon domain-containing protein [bacterium]
MGYKGKKLTEDEMYCPHCGEIIQKKDEICPECGVRVITAKPMLIMPDIIAGNKEKLVAVILAVVTGFWSWLYTYKKDAWKFWLNLGLCVVTLTIWYPVTVVWAFIDAVLKPNVYYEKYPNG